jgi:hypothetical protein
MYSNLNSLMNGDGSGSSGGSGTTGSGVDYSKDIDAFQTAVAAIPSTFNTSSWENVFDAVKKVPSTF